MEYETVVRLAVEHFGHKLEEVSGDASGTIAEAISGAGDAIADAIRYSADRFAEESQ
jgi:hypothetical protein